ncbi:MAG TPA: CpaF family protein [Candidatus Diapherotrites archaeon]|uniref:CpaF family protein n=1 Tax=Candidatus Iainarchaeum sp. TaxID=3101447 RepID=A0A7J4IYW1_9ARCH|nr:CpaF family protein [Candidatus Diapherotrites archaeon]
MVFEPASETEQAELALGWGIISIAGPHISKFFSRGHQRDIAQLNSGKKIYIIRAIPQLSAQEAKLLAKIIHEYRAMPRSCYLRPQEILESYCTKNFLEIEDGQKEYLCRALANACHAQGILTELLADESLEEIAVIGTGRSKPVYVFDSSFGWLETNVYFSCVQEIKDTVNSMAGAIGRRVTLQKPLLNAYLPGGERLNACTEPAALAGAAVTIRKFKSSPLTPSDIIQSGCAGEGEMAFLWMALQADCSALVCGNTGSGKTTLLNSLFSFIPSEERIVIVEETPEINIPQRHCVKLAVAEGIDLSVQQLITNTLRMRPDRVVVGEVRSREEAGAFIDTLLAGQGKGCYATFHAQSATDCLRRLSALGVHEIDLEALDLIITQRRWSVYSGGQAREERKMTQICESEAGKPGKLALREIFRYSFKEKEFMCVKKPQRAYEKIMRAFSLSYNELESELQRRAQFLLSHRGEGHEQFFSAIQGYAGQDAQA